MTPPAADPAATRRYLENNIATYQLGQLLAWGFEHVCTQKLPLRHQQQQKHFTNPWKSKLLTRPQYYDSSVIELYAITPPAVGPAVNYRSLRNTTPIHQLGHKLAWNSDLLCSKKMPLSHHRPVKIYYIATCFKLVNM